MEVHTFLFVVLIEKRTWSAYSTHFQSVRRLGTLRCYGAGPGGLKGSTRDDGTQPGVRITRGPSSHIVEPVPTRPSHRFF